MKWCISRRLLVLLGTSLWFNYCFAGPNMALPAPVYQPGETAICTSVSKAALNPARPILPNNPIDRLSLMPTICSGGGMNQSEIPGGVRQLLSAGWRIAQASHQVTSLGASSGETGVELLISGLFVLERQLFGVPAR
jgi:hypothetical protein